MSRTQYWASGWRLSFGPIVVAVLAANDVCAIGPLSQTRALTKNHHMSDPQLAQSLAALKATKATLQNANHDYGGHRAAAVKAIGAAEHQLQQALGFKQRKGGHLLAHAGRRVPAHHGGGTAIREPQAASDAQLAAAIPLLQSTMTSLQHANHDFGGHRAKAVRDLGLAVGQLNQALAFIKVREAKRK